MFCFSCSSKLVSESLDPNGQVLDSNMNSGLCKVSHQNSSFHNSCVLDEARCTVVAVLSDWNVQA